MRVSPLCISGGETTYDNDVCPAQRSSLSVQYKPLITLQFVWEYTLLYIHINVVSDESVLSSGISAILEAITL